MGRATSPEMQILQQRFREAQDGSEAAYRVVLSWTAERARSRCAALRALEEAVRAALLLLHKLRHTYQPTHCPAGWVDGIIALALRNARWNGRF